jgi:flagellar assembly protein FliH
VSSQLAEAAEVLRGMDVESVPVRLVRPRPAPRETPATKPMPDVSAEEELLRQRVENAARQGHEEGARAGYEAGWRKGLEAAAAESEAALALATADAKAALKEQQDKLSHLAGVLQRAIEDALDAAEDEMVALSFETICRVIGAADLRPEAVRAQLTALAGQARARRRLRVHVHPEDASLLQASASKGSVEWVPDPDVTLGGCIVRGSHGGLDARLEAMLEACKSALLAARARRTLHRAEGCAQ